MKTLHQTNESINTFPKGSTRTAAERTPVMEESDEIKRLEGLLDDACSKAELEGWIKQMPHHVRDWYGSRRSKQKKDKDGPMEKLRDF